MFERSLWLAGAAALAFSAGAQAQGDGEDPLERAPRVFGTPFTYGKVTE